MPVQLNPGVIAQAAVPYQPLNSLGQTYADALKIHSMQAASDQNDEALRQKQLLNDAFKASTDAQGNVDQNKVMAYVAQNGGGSNIPAMQKYALDNAKARADIGKTQADTNSANQTMLHKSLDLVNNTVASLAANPATTDRDVYGAVGQLVNAGAFDTQAAQHGMSPDDYARQVVLSTMPVGNPSALHNWLIQQGARAADASERLKLMLPKYDSQDQGGVINQGTINQFTGERTAGPSVVKTATPDALLSAETTRRGQDLSHGDQQEANSINKTASRQQIIETPTGLVSVDKGTNVATPITAAGGNNAVYSDKSTPAKNAQMVGRLQTMIPEARQLLESGATSSGVGEMRDKAMAFLGGSTDSADKASKLDVLSGWMTSNVPRFEGPQSDKDTATYRTMAGLVGDRSQPLSRRKAALDTLEQVMRGYQLAPSGALTPSTQATVPYTGPDRRRAPGAAAGRPSLDSFFSTPGG